MLKHINRHSLTFTKMKYFVQTSQATKINGKTKNIKWQNKNSLHINKIRG